MSFVDIYSMLFGIIGICIGIFAVIQLKGRISYISSLSTLIGWFAYHIIFIVLKPIPSPFVDYLIVEWMFIPEILLVMTFREKILRHMVIYSIILLAVAVAAPWVTIFGSAMIMIVPVVAAMLSVYRNIALGILYMVLCFVILFINLLLSGSPNPIGGALGFSLFWVIFSVGLGLLFYTTKDKQRPSDCSAKKSIALEVQRKMVHVMLLAFYIAIILGMSIVQLIYAAYVGIMGGLPELEYLIAQGSDSVETMLIRYAFAMLMFPFFVTDFLRLRFTDRYTPAVGYSLRVARRKEHTRFLGSTDILIGGAIGLLFMDKFEIIITIMVIVVADIASALVGIAFGKHKIYQGKTIEGTIAGVICATVAAWAISGMPLFSLLAGLTFIGADILSDIIPASDNLIAPIGIAIVFNLI